MPIITRHVSWSSGDSKLPTCPDGPSLLNVHIQGIALSQLDSLRKDLLRAAKDRVDFVLYNKVPSSYARELSVHVLSFQPVEQ